MKKSIILGCIIIISLLLAACGEKITKEEAKATANDFVERVLEPGQAASMVSTDKHGPWWESHITVDGTSVVLFIDEKDGKLVGIECPDRGYIPMEIFEERGGDGSGCWKQSVTVN